MFKKRKRLDSRYLAQLSRDIDPDEIFLDATNLPDFDKDQFEGRIEKPIGKGVILVMILVFLLIEGVFLIQTMNLQIFQGREFFMKSERNRLEAVPIFAMRGIIYDRKNVRLAWNAFEENTEVKGAQASSTKEAFFARREYISKSGFGHVLGYVSSPKRDRKGKYYQESFRGVDGLEEFYDTSLEGKNGRQLVEVDALGRVESGNIVERPIHGKSLTLTIDARVQEKFYATIQNLAQEKGYVSGAGVIMDVANGEILSLVSYPEYESSILSDGVDKKTIQEYLVDKRLVFLDRAVSGVYTPGSIVKPIMAIAALNEGLILPEKQILSTGSISIQNPYNPALKSVFNDWKAHGWVDMRQAIAVSSDVYFYAVGGGFADQKGLGIGNIEKYARMFGFGDYTGIDLAGEKNGTVPNPTWKASMFKGEPWRLGDTYHTVIGQYGFQVTPLQATRAIGAITNSGTLVTPRLVSESPQRFLTEKIPIPEKHFSVAREGMREGVINGTVTGLNVGYVKVAAKTGTAEIDAGKKYINSWVVGFFPYEKPRYVFTVVMERGPYQNNIGGVYVMRQMLDWMSINTPEYIDGL